MKQRSPVIMQLKLGEQLYAMKTAKWLTAAAIASCAFGGASERRQDFPGALVGSWNDNTSNLDKMKPITLEWTAPEAYASTLANIQKMHKNLSLNEEGKLLLEHFNDYFSSSSFELKLLCIFCVITNVDTYISSADSPFESQS